MSECVNWPVLLAVLGTALGLFVIVLLSGCFLTTRLDARSRSKGDIPRRHRFGRLPQDRQDRLRRLDAMQSAIEQGGLRYLALPATGFRATWVPFRRMCGTAIEMPPLAPRSIRTWSPYIDLFRLL